nr:ATP-binding protein [Streptomyces lacrimifluminis]
MPELRRAVREWFGEDAYGRVGADVQLRATELVGNVIRHVGEGTPVSVRVACVDGARIRVEVSDPDPRALPVLLSATGGDGSGRGLALLGALAVRWGVEIEAVGKTVVVRGGGRRCPAGHGASVGAGAAGGTGGVDGGEGRAGHRGGVGGGGGRTAGSRPYLRRP